jgi:DNA polymerase-3 subunit epsilon
MAVFDGSKLTESLYWLIRPPKGYGWFLQDFTDNCHGLTWFDVRWSPEFPAIAPRFFEHLNSADVVIAHNAQFDLGALQAITEHFGLASPSFDYFCTCRVAKRLWPEPRTLVAEAAALQSPTLARDAHPDPRPGRGMAAPQVASSD